MKCQDRHNEDRESGEAHEVKPPEPGRPRGQGVIRVLECCAGRTAVLDALGPNEQQMGQWRLTRGPLLRQTLRSEVHRVHGSDPAEIVQLGNQF